MRPLMGQLHSKKHEEIRTTSSYGHFIYSFRSILNRTYEEVHPLLSYLYAESVVAIWQQLR